MHEHVAVGLRPIPGDENVTRLHAPRIHGDAVISRPDQRSPAMSVRSTLAAGGNSVCSRSRRAIHRRVES
jgi:hypothetical protein